MWTDAETGARCSVYWRGIRCRARSASALGNRFQRPGLWCWLNPFPVLANQVFESIDGFGFGNIKFHRGLADVEIHFSRRAADVAEIRVGHFAGTVHNATHDGDLYTFQMQGGRFDFRCGGLQIEKSPSAGWAGYIISLENP